MATLNSRAFAAFLEERARRKDGYIMGAIGQDPKELSDWYFNQYTGEQRKRALAWKQSAERVWDCQGLAEGYINGMTGGKLNVRARDNYASWCDPRGAGAIPAANRAPGAAVFIHGGGAITHVGFLVRPVAAGRPAGDWYVVEARGVMHGVVTTKLSDRPWNRWGWMTRYFDYGAAESPRAGNVRIRGGDAFLRAGPGTGYAAAGVARAGESYASVEADGWVPVDVGGSVRWISGRYAKEE